jgi:hypothetical protein
MQLDHHRGLTRYFGDALDSDTDRDPQTITLLSKYNELNGTEGSVERVKPYFDHDGLTRVSLLNLSHAHWSREQH